MIRKLIGTFKASVEKKPSAAILVSLVIFILIFLFSRTSPYRLFELILYDLRFQLKPTIAQWEGLSFLNIDDNSIKNVGQFPWPRQYYADGIGVMDAAGVRQTTFDIQFIDPSGYAVRSEGAPLIEEKLKRKQTISADEAGKYILNSDGIFAGAMKSSGRIIIPYSFIKEQLTGRRLNPEEQRDHAAAIRLFTEKASIPVPVKLRKDFAGMIDPERKDIQYPIPQFIRSARGFGFVDSDFDIDGTSRRIRLVRMFDNRLYLHMGLVMAMDLCGVTKNNLRVAPGKSITLKDAINPVTNKKGDIVIPIDERGMMIINWAGNFEHSFHHLSYYALFEYNLVKDEVHGFFDEEEIKSGLTQRSSLYGALTRLQRELESAGDPTAKATASNAIRDTRKKITAIEKGYAKPLVEEAEKIRAELKKGESAKLSEALDNLENFITAINIVTEVERLRERSVIIGLTGTATQDIGVIPLSSEYMMVGSYPNIVNTILQNGFIHKSSAAVDYALMLIIAIAMGLLVQRFNATATLIVTLISLIAVNAANIAVFSFANIWSDQLGVSLALLLPAFIIGAVKFVSEESQKRFIKSAFGHYLSPHVIDEILKNPASLQLGGELRNITIFFSDVAGFSAISEKLTPPQLVQLLNEYLSEMTDIILAHDGTVDKYEGDAIIAFYGAPHPYPDHAVKACLASIEMKKRLAELRESWRTRGQNELRVRMGMNTGNAVVGNMGSRTRMDYTMMGDAVNLASRLEGANKFYGTYAMISEFTYEQAKDAIEARQLDYIKVVGKEEAILVYELLGKKGNLPDYMQEMLAKYNEGLLLFKEREWENAHNAFKSALRIVKDDAPSKTYLDRCAEFIENPPPKKWDGVYRLKTK